LNVIDSAEAEKDVANSYKAFPKHLLKDQVVAVTGGSRGIGRATALRLAEAGAQVVIDYHTHREAAEHVAEEVRSRGSKALVVKADVANLREVRQLVGVTLEHFGRLDAVVANAGIWEGAPIGSLGEELWDRVLDVNLKGTYTVAHAAAPVFQQQGRGNIVVVSSTAGQRGEAGYSNYAASKGGQISFTKALSNELAPAVRVNCVAPGWVDTDLNDPVFGASEENATYKDQVRRAIPLQRLALSDDVATTIVFLLSEWSRHITGEVINVNGGAVLCG
jgi:3-oxoacyl-[acyl-carrier protein] reductase